jgi:hypothetical protein
MVKLIKFNALFLSVDFFTFHGVISKTDKQTNEQTNKQTNNKNNTKQKTWIFNLVCMAHYIVRLTDII